MTDWSIVRAHFSDCPPGWRHDFTFPDWDVWTVLAGSCVLRQAERDLTLVAGDCLCLPPGVHQRIDPLPGSTVRICAIHCLAPRCAAPPLLRRFSDLPFALGLMQRIVRAQTMGGVYLAALHAERERHAKIPLDAWWQRLEELCTAIQTRPHLDYRGTTLARRFHCSAEHFSRRFREHTGRTFSDWIIGARLNRARQLLAESDLAVKTVAQQCGYASVHFFSRQFQQRTGLSPTAFRQQARA